MKQHTRHVPGQQSKCDDPYYQNEDIEDDVQNWREGTAARDDAGEQEYDQRQERSKDNLLMSVMRQGVRSFAYDDESPRDLEAVMMQLYAEVGNDRGDNDCRNEG